MLCVDFSRVQCIDVGGIVHGLKAVTIMTSEFPSGGYSGFQVMGMIERSQKSRPKKILRASSKTPKNPWTKN